MIPAKGFVAWCFWSCRISFTAFWQLLFHYSFLGPEVFDRCMVCSKLEWVAVERTSSHLSNSVFRISDSAGTHWALVNADFTRSFWLSKHARNCFSSSFSHWNVPLPFSLQNSGPKSTFVTMVSWSLVVCKLGSIYHSVTGQKFSICPIHGVGVCNVYVSGVCPWLNSTPAHALPGFLLIRPALHLDRAYSTFGGVYLPKSVMLLLMFRSEIDDICFTQAFVTCSCNLPVYLPLILTWQTWP